MSQYVGSYVKTCDLCLRTKTQRQQPFSKLTLLPTLEACWDTSSIDFIVELLVSGGYNTVMVAVDSLGKRAHFIETVTTITATGAAELFLRHVSKLHGLPHCVISDRGSQFVAVFTQELYRLLGIKITSSTAYHPQTNGQTE